MMRIEHSEQAETRTEAVEQPVVGGRLWPYTLGNGGAILVGLLSCYAGLALNGGLTLKGWDFFYYYSVSRLIVEGLGSQIYSLAALGHIERALAHPYHVPQGVIPNVYPPFFALALAPLAALPYTLAYLLWLAFNCFLLAGSLFYLEGLAHVRRRAGLLFRFGLILSLPVLVALLQGQASLVILAALTAMFISLRSGNEITAGISLSLVLIKPQYAPAFLLLLLVQRRWRAVLAFAAAGLALLALPVPLLGLNATESYLRVLTAAGQWGDRVGGFSPVVNRGFAGFADMLLPHGAAAIVSAVFAVAGLAVLGWFAFRTSRIEEPFALAVIVALLISPHVLIHDLCLLAIPVAVMARYRSQGPAHLGRLLVAADIAITLGFGVSYALPVQLSVFAMCGMAWWLVRLMQTSRRAGARRDTTEPAMSSASAG